MCFVLLVKIFNLMFIMSINYNKLSIGFYILVILFVTAYFGWLGYRFYNLPIEVRFYDPMYKLLKPSGLVGHGLGFIGTFFMVIGLFTYMARKRFRIFFAFGAVKYWLEFHMFMCTLGPILILYHTSFKFGGIISVAFWSMVAVWISGVIGRYLYTHIPHTIDGKELSLLEIQEMKEELDMELMNRYDIDLNQLELLKSNKSNNQFKSIIINPKDLKKIRILINKEMWISRRIKRLALMHKLFGYWHLVHLPFTFILLIIAIVHIGVELYFNYVWIFR